MATVINHTAASIDRSVTARYFGTGDGARLVWNLAGADSDRAILQPVLYQTNWQGGARSNWATYSQGAFNTQWTKSNAGNAAAPIITDNYALAPDGTLTASRLQLDRGATDVAGDYAQVSSNTLTTTVGLPICASIWAKTTDGSTKVIWFNNSQLNGIATVTGQWTRIFHQSNSTVANSSVRMGLRGSLGASQTADILVWGAQLEITSSPTAYIPTTSAAVTVYDVAPTQLYNTSRTNYCLQSQTLQTTWTPIDGNTSVSTDAAVAPDGTTTADKVQEATTTSASHIVSQAITLAQQTVTFSVYAKAAERSFLFLRLTSSVDVDASFNLGTGALGATGSGTGFVSRTITAVGNGWYRCTLTAALQAANPTVRLWISSTDNNNPYAGTAGSGVYCWGAQLETGSSATPYIPTTTGSVTVTDYSTDAAGKVTFAAAPAAGVPLAWKDPLASNVYRYLGTGDGSSTAFSLPFAPATPTIYIMNWMGGSRFNNIPYSSDQGNWTNIGSGPTASTDVALAPDGTMTADKLVFSASGSSNRRQVAGTYFQAVGVPSTLSIWMRGEVGGEVIKFWDGWSLLGTATLTTSWVRYQVTGNAAGQSMSFMIYANAGTPTIYVWGAMGEIGVSSATSYIPTGATGVMVTDVANTQLSPTSRTNLCLQSQTLDTSHATVNATITPNQDGAPDGTLTADRLNDDATNAGHSVQGSTVTVSTATYVYSVYAKAGPLSKIMLYGLNADGKGRGFDLTNGTSFTVSTVTDSPSYGITYAGNGWYRCWITTACTATTAAIGGVYGVTGTSYTYAGGTGTVVLWGMQLELGSTPTPYIPTTTVAVTVTDYSIDAAGKGDTTFATAPQAGATVFWTGTMGPIR